MKSTSFRNMTIARMLILFVLVALSISELKAQAEDYIQKYKYIAVREMELHGIPASITLAQGLLESGMGTSMLATKANNHFGIKCHKEWTGKTIKHTDDAPNECFRVYANAEESYEDHSYFLKSRPWYAPLFKLDQQDYKGWAHGLKKAGYATNPRYAEMLIDVIERHMLYAYDQGLSIARAEEQRTSLKQKEKEELLVLQNKTSPISTHSVCVEATVECRVPSNPHLSVFYNNNLKTIHVQKGETMKALSSKYKIALTKLYQYNDMKMNSPVQPGQLIYLEAKKKKAKQKTHLVLSHETLWSISQSYGVSLAKLQERNFLKPGEEPAAGATVYLNKQAPKKPAIRNGKTQQSPAQIVVEVPTSKDPIQMPSQPANNNSGIPAPKTVPSVTPKANVPQANPFNNGPQNEGVNQPVVANGKQHIVEKGDTLYNISKRYNVTVSQIKEWNDIFDETIKLGQVLIIKQ